MTYAKHYRLHIENADTVANVILILNNSDRVKLNYLIPHCVRESPKNSESFTLLLPSKGYNRAKQLLKEQYGRSHIVARRWFRN